jgi:excisionase family DNA binding protein
MHTATDELLTRRETAEFLKLREQTLACMACQGRGPAYIKCGRAVRYRKSDLDAWLESRTVHTADCAVQGG